MNCTTSCINVAVGGCDCFTNRHLVKSFLSQGRYKSGLCGKELRTLKKTGLVNIVGKSENASS